MKRVIFQFYYVTNGLVPLRPSARTGQQQRRSFPLNPSLLLEKQDSECNRTPWRKGNPDSAGGTSEAREDTVAIVTKSSRSVSLSLSLSVVQMARARENSLATLSWELKGRCSATHR